jgi:hypothetical protein
VGLLGSAGDDPRRPNHMRRWRFTGHGHAMACSGDLEFGRACARGRSMMLQRRWCLLWDARAPEIGRTTATTAFVGPTRAQRGRASGSWAMRARESEGEFSSSIPCMRKGRARGIGADARRLGGVRCLAWSPRRPDVEHVAGDVVGSLGFSFGPSTG